jgi:hypothetical protein
VSTLVDTHEALRGGPLTIVNDTNAVPIKSPNYTTPGGLTPCDGASGTHMAPAVWPLPPSRTTDRAHGRQRRDRDRAAARAAGVWRPFDAAFDALARDAEPVVPRFGRSQNQAADVFSLDARRDALDAMAVGLRLDSRRLVAVARWVVCSLGRPARHSGRRRRHLVHPAVPQSC